MAVRSSGATTAARKACRGAESMLCVQDRVRRKSIANVEDDGTGMSASDIADGRCVKTIVSTSPMRLAIDAATKVDNEAIMPAAKKRVPSLSKLRLNLS